MLFIYDPQKKGRFKNYFKINGLILCFKWVLLKVSQSQTPRTSQHVVRWRIGEALSTDSNTESLTVNHLCNVFGQCHTTFTLKTFFADFEKEQAHCSCYNCSSISNSTYLSVAVKIVDPVDPSLHSFLYSFFCILLNLFSSPIQMKQCSLDVKK